MYFAQNVPFTFDDLPEFAMHDAEVIGANASKCYEEEDLQICCIFVVGGM